MTNFEDLISVLVFIIIVAGVNSAPWRAIQGDAGNVVSSEDTSTHHMKLRLMFVGSERIPWPKGSPETDPGYDSLTGKEYARDKLVEAAWERKVQEYMRDEFGLESVSVNGIEERPWLELNRDTMGLFLVFTTNLREATDSIALQFAFRKEVSICGVKVVDSKGKLLRSEKGKFYFSQHSGSSPLKKRDLVGVTPSKSRQFTKAFHIINMDEEFTTGMFWLQICDPFGIIDEEEGHSTIGKGDVSGADLTPSVASSPSTTPGQLPNQYQSPEVTDGSGWIAGSDW